MGNTRLNLLLSHLKNNKSNIEFLSGLFFLFTTAPTVYGISRARGWLRAAAAAYTTMTDWIWVSCVTYAAGYGNARSLTQCVRPGIDPASSQKQRWVLNPLSCNGNSFLSGIFILFYFILFYFILFYFILFFCHFAFL